MSVGVGKHPFLGNPSTYTNIPTLGPRALAYIGVFGPSQGLVIDFMHPPDYGNLGVSRAAMRRVKVEFSQ